MHQAPPNAARHLSIYDLLKELLMATIDELYQALANAKNAGNTQAVNAIAQEIQRQHVAALNQPPVADDGGTSPLSMLNGMNRQLGAGGPTRLQARFLRRDGAGDDTNFADTVTPADPHSIGNDVTNQMITQAMRGRPAASISGNGPEDAADPITYPGLRWLDQAERAGRTLPTGGSRQMSSDVRAAPPSDNPRNAGNHIRNQPATADGPWDPWAILAAAGQQQRRDTGNPLAFPDQMKAQRDPSAMEDISWERSGRWRVPYSAFNRPLTQSDIQAIKDYLNSVTPKPIEDPVIARYDALPWYGQAGQAADDVIRMLANDLTLGHADNFASYMNGDDLAKERQNSRDARTRAGSAGDLADLTDKNVDDFGRTFARGVPIFGSYADEMNAGINATVAPYIASLVPRSWVPQPLPEENWNDRYNHALQIERAKDANIDENHPVFATAGKLGGSAATIAATALRAPALVDWIFGNVGKTIVPRMAAATVAGTIGGAAQGFGDGQGDLKNRLGEAGKQAEFGALLAPAQTLLGIGASKLIPYIKSKILGEGIDVQTGLPKDEKLSPGAAESREDLASSSSETLNPAAKQEFDPVTGKPLPAIVGDPPIAENTAGGQTADESGRLRPSSRKSHNGIHLPPNKKARPFSADYANPVRGQHYDPTTGKLLLTIDGDAIGADAAVVGRQTLNKRDRPLPASKRDDITIATTGKGPTIKPMQSGDLGQFENVPTSRVQKQINNGGYESEVTVDSGLSKNDAGLVQDHENGHAINNMVGTVITWLKNGKLKIPYRDIPITPEMEPELETVYRDVNGNKMPKDFGYLPRDEPSELMAEAVRAYMENPNYFKTVAPNTAKQIRAYVNSHPLLKDHILFNARTPNLISDNYAALSPDEGTAAQPRVPNQGVKDAIMRALLGANPTSAVS